MSRVALSHSPSHCHGHSCAQHCAQRAVHRATARADHEVSTLLVNGPHHGQLAAGGGRWRDAPSALRAPSELGVSRLTYRADGSLINIGLWLAWPDRSLGA